ncbi:MAG: T9SS type A sorting domain-containing protein [Flavobacteriales bacterium]|nr:T9SS type A sorting domain-containing protein [Flavobacteriales bacterium]
MSRFTATIINEGIFLEWTLTAGNTCQGIAIERALVGEAFEEIGTIEGVCGSQEKDEDFFFVDTSPISGAENRYRLLLGASGYTEEISLEYFDVGDEGFLLVQDAQGVSLWTERNDLEDMTFTIFDAQGHEMEKDVITRGENRLNTDGLRQGLYIVGVMRAAEPIFVDQFVKF